MKDGGNPIELIRKLRRERTALRDQLRDLTCTVSRAIAALDAEMQQPSTVERGKRIAQICNGMQLANDCAKRFGLGKERTSSSGAPCPAGSTKPRAAKVKLGTAILLGGRRYP